MIIVRVLMICVFVVTFGAAAFGQDYPVKPVKIITPYTEGSATDVIARIVSKKLSEIWGQPVKVENRPGSGGSIGVGMVAKAPPDGYTLLVHSSSHAEHLALYDNLTYTQQDFIDLASLARQPMVLFVSPSSAIKSVAELIAEAKAKPMKVKFGSPGTGSTSHLAAEQFKGMAGINTVHVPFQGAPEAADAVKKGSINYAFLPLAVVMKGVKDGSLRALGVTGAKRTPELPDVATIAESGLSGYEATVWWGIWAPAGIPAGIKDKLVRDVGKALASPDTREQFKKNAFEPISMSPEKFASFVQSERQSAAMTIGKAGIKAQVTRTVPMEE